MFYNDVRISLEYEDWNNIITSPTTCVVMAELVTCRGKVKVVWHLGGGGLMTLLGLWLRCIQLRNRISVSPKCMCRQICTSAWMYGLLGCVYLYSTFATCCYIAYQYEYWFLDVHWAPSKQAMTSVICPQLYAFGAQRHLADVMSHNPEINRRRY